MLSVPMVHMNGTSRQSLVEGYSAAALALDAAMEALRATYPNGRDYYLKPSLSLRDAEDQHRARLAKLTEVRMELMELAIAVQNQ